MCVCVHTIDRSIHFFFRFPHRRRGTWTYCSSCCKQRFISTGLLCKVSPQRRKVIHIRPEISPLDLARQRIEKCPLQTAQLKAPLSLSRFWRRFRRMLSLLLGTTSQFRRIFESIFLHIHPAISLAYLLTPVSVIHADEPSLEV